MSNNINIQEIKSSLSIARIKTYENAFPQDQNQLEKAIELYAWNASVSAEFLGPLHICEVVIRNAVAEAIEMVYGDRWPWSTGFEQSLPSPRFGYNPSQDLFNAKRGQHSTGKVIPELKFVFWQKLFTRRFDQRIWHRHLRTVLPNLPSNKTDTECRELIYDELEKVRYLRNRIAHHEPVFSRNLSDDIARVTSLVRYRSTSTADWMTKHFDVVDVIAQKP